MSLNVETASHIGNRRKRNEDRYLARRRDDGSLLIAVADGMGGLPGGEQASTLAVETLSATASTVGEDKETLLRMVMNAHRAVLDYADAHPGLDGMGSTLTAAIVREGSVSWAHVGDSRLYLFHKGRLSQLTSDHRFLTSMLKDGDISASQARRHPLRNMLDQCLGCPEIEPDLGESELAPKDIILLCSDGLYEEVPHRLMTAILAQRLPLEIKVELLMRRALKNAGKDNITLVLVENPR